MAHGMVSKDDDSICRTKRSTNQLDGSANDFSG